MTTKRDLEAGIRRSIGDPNSIVGKRQPDEKGYMETITRWQTRAVMETLKKHGLVEKGN